jgi:hypothetical protein
MDRPIIVNGAPPITCANQPGDPADVPGGDMRGPFFMMRNKHTPAGSEPPAITNEVEGQYLGYFENRHGEQWVFVYDRVAQTGELRGGDVGWETVIPVREGQASIILGAAEAEWLSACWKAATDSG